MAILLAAQPASGQEAVAPCPYSCVPAPSSAPAEDKAPAETPHADRLDHLLKAVAHLEAAGLHDRARDLRAEVDRERRTVLQRLEALEQEIERLRNLTGQDSQIMVHVQVIELPAGKLRELGLEAEWCGAGNTGNAGFRITDDPHPLASMLDALRKHDLAKVIAEPTLVTVSGRPAHCQIGGELPILIPQENETVAIEYKQYGTRIDLVPSLLGNQTIRLEIRLGLSELDSTKSVRVPPNNVSVPALRVRQVDTSVEMKAGQMLMLGGLVHNGVEANKRSITWFSDVPYVGRFFQWVVLKPIQTDLLVLVTPEIVRCEDLAQEGQSVRR
jgi:Flp pilus assembly secretin CpaC